MAELVKHIEPTLKERGFCVVFEDELERYWQAKRSTLATERKRVELSPDHINGPSLFSIPIPALCRRYSSLRVEGPPLQ